MKKIITWQVKIKPWQRSFWILRGREEVRERENNCYGCKRRKAKIAKQIMGPFPAIRLKQPLRAFSKL